MVIKNAKIVKRMVDLLLLVEGTQEVAKVVITPVSIFTNV